MEIPTQKQIKEVAELRCNDKFHYIDEEEAFKDGFKDGTSYMTQQLEPIITELEMKNARLGEALARISNYEQSVDEYPFYVMLK